jgi:hypothetical protein
MNYLQLQQAIQDYSENTESLFVLNIPTFVQEAEKRIYNSVQLPSLRRNVRGSLTAGNPYLSLPSDWLSTYSIAVIDATGRYNYLLNKDVNFLREAYPTESTTGEPKYYALFGPTSNNPNELSAMVAPTPSFGDTVELHYFYYPISIVQGQITSTANVVPGTLYTNGVYQNVSLTGGSGTGATADIVVLSGAVNSITIENQGSLYVINDVLTVSPSDLGGSGTGFQVTVEAVGNVAGTSWLGDNYDPVLFYGAMREAVIFMKGEQDMVTYYEKMFQDALSQLNRLGTGLERGDAYRDGQAKIKVNP